MIKKLSAVGTSLEFIIERPINDIRPVKLGGKERIRESTKRMMTVHDETLRELAR